MTKKDLFILLDGNALIHRAFHALPPLKTKKGELVNALYGFISILFKIVKELDPKYLGATFDLAGPTFRDLEYKEYKGKRVKADQELYDQIPKIKDFVKTMNVPVYEKKGFEADDLIGTIVEELKKENLEVLIATGDLDTLQLVTDKTKIYSFKKGINQTTIYDKKAIMERYGLTPEQIIDFKGLKGDPSDNIPGVQGVGEKTALDLVKEYKNLENIYQNLDNLNPKLKARLLEYKEDAFFSRYLATIKRDVPVNFKLRDCLRDDYSKNKVIKFLERFEFKTLIKRLNELEN